MRLQTLFIVVIFFKSCFAGCENKTSAFTCKSVTHCKWKTGMELCYGGISANLINFEQKISPTLINCATGNNWFQVFRRRNCLESQQNYTKPVQVIAALVSGTNCTAQTGLFRPNSDVYFTVEKIVICC